ncbi:MAG TPA: hypothetical protein VF244_00350 [Acidimicrobiales bacterium]
MIDFGVLPVDEAQAYCEALVAGIPERRAWLRSTVAATGGPVDACDSGRDGLGPLWAWLVGQIDAPEDGGTAPPGRPPWYSPERANPHLSDRALWLIDGVGTHLAEIVRAAVPDAHWAVYRVAARLRDVNQHRTMLHGLPGQPADPVQMVYGEVIGKVVHGEPHRPDALVRLYDHLVGQT